MSEFVRVRLENGMETTVSTDYAESAGLEVIDADATNSRGVPLPATRKNGRRAKPRTTVSKEAAKKTATEKAASPAADTTGTSGSGSTPEEAS